MKAKIAVLPGDGIGPEVTVQARRVLEMVGENFDHEFSFEEAHVGGIAIDECGDPLPEQTLNLCRESDAVLFGAIGGPKWDDPNAPMRPEQGLLRLRRGLGVFANIRPVKPHPDLIDQAPLKPELLRDADLIIIRELTGGIYFGHKSRENDVAVDTCTYSVGEVERIVRIAASLAREREGRLTSVDKANVLETSRLWRATVERVVRDEFPDVKLEHVLVDAAAMHLLQKPDYFDVIVTENMFGDILTDEASVLAGSMGLLPSASLSDDGPGLYEPIHGSAPDIAGLGIANPYAAISSAAMLLRHSLKLDEEADAVERAVARAVHEGALTVDLVRDERKSMTTAEVGDRVCELLSTCTACLSMSSRGFGYRF